MTYMGLPLSVLVERYNMSVAAANEALVPCGDSKGKPLGDCSAKEIYWFASRTTSMKNTEEFRRAVSAARIIRAAKAEQQERKSGPVNKIKDPHAKTTLAHCRDCERQFRISRRLLDRASTRCYACGGMLDSDDLPLDEYLTLKEATHMTGLTVAVLRAAITRKEIVGQKAGNAWRLTRSSVLNYARKNAESRDRRNHGFVTRTCHVCPNCNRPFRNLAALALHVTEAHPVVQRPK